MKIIQKLQGGGMPAFVSYTNIPQPQPAAPYASEQGTSQSGGPETLLDKDMTKLLYENGIPSDVEVFIDQSGLFGSGFGNEGNPFSKENSILKYKAMLKMLPRIKAESDRLKSAMSIAEKNDGLGEIAVDESGYVFTRDEDGNLTKKSIQSVNFGKERVITNSELANYRTNERSAAFNTNITSVISNGVGVSKITDFIRNITDKLGSDSTTRDGYVSQQAGKLLKGLEYLEAINVNPAELAGMSLDGIYKVSGMDKNQSTQAQLAINYIMANLPTNMRTVLQAKAAMAFGDNTESGVRKLVAMLTGSALKGERTFNVEFKENLDSTGAKKSTSGGKDDNIIDAAKMFALGMGDRQVYTINNGNSYDLKLLGTRGVITDKSGKPLGRATLADVNNSAFAGTLDLENATMGSQLLDLAQMDRVALNGSTIVGVDLPLDIEAQTRGITRPDLSALKRLEAADDEIKSGGITDVNEINRIYAAHGLPFKYAGNGNINVNSYGRFAILGAYADESAFTEDAALDDTLKLVDDEFTRGGVERILQAADKNYKMAKSGWFSSGTPIYSGSVYIPVISNMLNVAAGSGNYPTLQGNDAALLEAKQQAKEVAQTYQKPASLSSYLN